MHKLLQINITANWGSHGKIAEDIGNLALAKGWESYIAYGRRANESKSRLIRIGSDWDEKMHALQSRFFDNHGMASIGATRNLIKHIERIGPDIIHLHNIHGYYLNYSILFDFLKRYDRPVVWTLHDCWPMTGHCAYFTYANCDKWKQQCNNCKWFGDYPKSLFLDRSKRNYEAKQNAFTKIDNLTIVPVSEWLNGVVSQSFLKKYSRVTIHNGINLDVFKPLGKVEHTGRKIILGVSSVWDRRKGLKDFFSLRDLLPQSEYRIIVIGLTPKQKNALADGIEGITRTNNINELVSYYSSADVFVNPTYEDNFPTTNLEALACGTPVITYNTGGSPEAVDEKTGIVVDYGNVHNLADSIRKMCNSEDMSDIRNSCRERAMLLFDKNNRYKDYIKLYDSLLR